MLIYTKYDPRFYDKRLNKGGGDGGAADMRAQEQERQAKIANSIDSINQIFGKTPAAAAAANARNAMYGDIQDAVTKTNMRELDRQFTSAQDNNQIGLARSGLLGGSVDAASGGILKERYGEGKLRATQAGLSASSDLRNADEKTRQTLIGLAQSGTDAGTASSLAASQMDAAAKTAQAQGNTATLGRLFDDMSQSYVQQNRPRAVPAAYQPYAGGGSLFSGRGYSGSMS